VTLEIPLETVNRTGIGPLYIAHRERLATATAVKFVNRDTLAIGSLVGQSLSLARVDWERGSYEIVAEIEARHPVDLMDFDGRDRLVTSNCKDPSVSLYRVRGSSIDHIADVPIPEGYCHGARFVPGADVVCAAFVTGRVNVCFVSVSSGKVIYAIPNDEGWRAMDVCFLSVTRMIVAYTHRKPSPDPVPVCASKVCLVEIKRSRQRHRVLFETTITGHVDSVAAVGDRVYVSDQLNDRVLLYRRIGDTLRLKRTLTGYDFPHGIDVMPAPEGDLLAVSNYGSNSVRIDTVEPL
jgi:hypothetical protein